MKRTRVQTLSVVIGSLAVMAAGCGSEAGLSATGPSPTFSAGVIQIAPAGVIVGTSVALESRGASDPSGGSLSYAWDFGDGSTGSGEATTHVYAGAGVYMATSTIHSSEAGSAQTTLNISVRSLTGRWSGDFGQVSITQDGFDLRGTYEEGPRQGKVEGRVSEAGIVTFTMTSPGLGPVTFTGTAGPDVLTLVGAASGRDAAKRPLTLFRG